MRVLPIFSRLAAHVMLAIVTLTLFACGDDPDESRARSVEATTATPVRDQPNDSETDTTASEDPLVVFLGDSFAAGLHLPSDEAFPAVLQRSLADDGVPFRLINAGSSGDTTAGGLSRIDWLLKRSPDWIVVELGGNDGLRGIAIESIEENLDAIVARSLAAGAHVLLLGMRLPPNYGPDYTSKFEALFARVAEERDVLYVPFFLEGVGGVPELNLPDGIHPTAEGHRRIAENLAPVLRRALKSDATRAPSADSPR